MSVQSREAKRWILRTVSKKFKRATEKSGPKGHTTMSLIEQAVKERRTVCTRLGLKANSLKRWNKDGLREKIRTDNLTEPEKEKLPPGEDRIRRYLKDLESEGKIEFYSKPTSRNGGNVKSFGGAGRKRIIVPTDSGKKIMQYGSPHVIKLLNDKNKLEQIIEKDLNGILRNEIVSYVVLKNKIFQSPIEAVATDTELGRDMFEFIREEVVINCENFERKLKRNNKEFSTALESLKSLSMMPEYIVEPLSLILRGHQNRLLNVSKHVNVIHDAFPDER